MAKEVEFRLNTTAKDAKWMRGNALAAGLKIDATQVRSVVEKSMQPSLMALRRNVQQAKPKTGRLRRSPGIVTRKYGGSQRLVIVGLVGYKARVAPHARYLEFGTPPVGNRRPIVARRYAWLAFFSTREEMKRSAQEGLQSLMAEAADGLE